MHRYIKKLSIKDIDGHLERIYIISSTWIKKVLKNKKHLKQRLLASRCSIEKPIQIIQTKNYNKDTSWKASGVFLYFGEGIHVDP